MTQFSIITASMINHILTPVLFVLFIIMMYQTTLMKWL